MSPLGLESLLFAFAFVLLVGGVVGSVTPQVPGALVSLAGVYLYWIASGMTEPGTLLLALLTLAGLLTWVVDVAGGAVAARVGGASNWTAVLAGVVALVLFFATGPFGILLGVAGTVFVVEFYRQGDARGGLRAAVITTVGMLASGVVQALLTASILATIVAVVLI